MPMREATYRKSDKVNKQNALLARSQLPPNPQNAQKPVLEVL
jgi:hypothetical protein